MTFQLISKVKRIVFASKLFEDSFWAIVGSITSRTLGLGSAIIVARLLGKSIYGEYGMIRNTVLSIAILSTFGLGYTATKFIAEYKDKNAHRILSFYSCAMHITLVFGVTMSALIYFFSKEIAIGLESKGLESSLKIISVWVLFNSLSVTQVGMLAGLGEFKQMAKVNTIIGFATFFFTISLTYFHGLNGSLVALVLSQFMNCALNYRLLKLKLPRNHQNRERGFKIYKDVLFFSLPIALQEITYSVTAWLNYYLILRLTGYDQVGLFNAANQWLGIILFLPGILKNVLLTHLSSSNADNTKYDNIMTAMLKVNFISTLFPILAILILSQFTEFVYGDSFDSLGVVIRSIIFSAFFLSLCNVYTQGFLSKGRNWEMFWIQLIYRLGILLLFYFLITVYDDNNGAMIFGISSTIMSFFYLVVSALLFKFFFGFGNNDAN